MRINSIKYNDSVVDGPGIRTILFMQLIVFCGSIIIVPFITLSRINDEYFSMTEMLPIGLGIVLIFLLLISPFVFIPLYKMLYLMKHYSEFKLCIVKMTNPQLA